MHEGLPWRGLPPISNKDYGWASLKNGVPYLEKLLQWKVAHSWQLLNRPWLEVKTPYMWVHSILCTDTKGGT